MKKNKNNNKVLYVLIIILLVCTGLIGYEFYKYFYAGTGGSKYGDRLEGIENYPLKDTLVDDIKAIYAQNTSVGEIKTQVQGKIIYITIDFKENIKVASAKDLAIKALQAIGEKNLNYYDVQYILTSSYEAEDKETKYFPVFGAKNSNSSKVVW